MSDQDIRNQAAIKSMPATNIRGECLCARCCDERLASYPPSGNLEKILDRLNDGNFRYACEICGNKRCPHHGWHELKCTGSNEPDQRAQRLAPRPGEAALRAAITAMIPTAAPRSGEKK